MFQSIRKNVTWRAVVIAGIVAGIVFLVVNFALTAALYQFDLGLLLRYNASLVMGSGVLTQSTPAALVVGVLVHFALSLFFALIISIVVHRWGLWVGIIGGGLLGLAIYAIDLYSLTTLFPWFFAINNPALAVSHVLFGMVAGGVYETFDHYDTPFLEEGKGHAN